MTDPKERLQAAEFEILLFRIYCGGIKNYQYCCPRFLLYLSYNNTYLKKIWVAIEACFIVLLWVPEVDESVGTLYQP